MLNNFAKSLLVSTSLSPVLCVVAINQFEHGRPWTIWIWWLVIAICLAFLCQYILKRATNSAQRILFYIEEFESKDHEMLTFLFIYLLPLIRSDHSTLINDWLTSTFVLAIIVLAVAYTGAFHFNPVMRLFGYRFYAVKDQQGITKLLISKRNLLQSKKEVKTAMLSWNVLLLVEGQSDA